ncbi:hypothetical protein ACTFIR_003822 [Dictyostelium discoideum]
MNTALHRIFISPFEHIYLYMYINLNHKTFFTYSEQSQSHVMYIIRIKNSSTAELLMKSWEPSTLKVYSCSYTRFRNFCISNSLNPANITLVVFMDYLKHSRIDLR